MVGLFGTTTLLRIVLQKCSQNVTGSFRLILRPWVVVPLSLNIVQNVINLSCRHPHHASSPSVASKSARCTNCGNLTIFPVAPLPECDVKRLLTVLHHQIHARSCRHQNRFSRLSFIWACRSAKVASNTIETGTGLLLESTVQLESPLSFQCVMTVNLIRCP